MVAAGRKRMELEHRAMNVMNGHKAYEAELGRIISEAHNMGLEVDTKGKLYKPTKIIEQMANQVINIMGLSQLLAGNQRSITNQNWPAKYAPDLNEIRAPVIKVLTRLYKNKKLSIRIIEKK